MDDRTKDDDEREVYYVVKYKWVRGTIPGGHPGRQHHLVHDGEPVLANANSYEDAAQTVCECEVEETNNLGDMLCRVFEYMGNPPIMKQYKKR